MAGINIAADALNTTSTTPIHALGQRCDVDGVSYRYVYNSSATTAITAYYPAYFATTDNIFHVVGYATSGVNNALIAGIAHTSLGTLEYGWAACNGLHTAYVTAQVTAGYAVKATAVGLIAAAATTDCRAGWVVVGTTVAGNSVVYLNI